MVRKVTSQFCSALYFTHIPPSSAVVSGLLSLLCISRCLTQPKSKLTQYNWLSDACLRFFPSPLSHRQRWEETQDTQLTFLVHSTLYTIQFCCVADRCVFSSFMTVISVSIAAGKTSHPRSHRQHKSLCFHSNYHYDTFVNDAKSGGVTKSMQDTVQCTVYAGSGTQTSLGCNLALTIVRPRYVLNGYGMNSQYNHLTCNGYIT